MGPEPSIPAAGSQGPCIHPTHHSGVLTFLPSVCLTISKAFPLMCPLSLPRHPFSLPVPPSTQPGLTWNRSEDAACVTSVGSGACAGRRARESLIGDAFWEPGNQQLDQCWIHPTGFEGQPLTKCTLEHRRGAHSLPPTSPATPVLNPWVLALSSSLTALSLFSQLQYP